MAGACYWSHHIDLYHPLQAINVHMNAGLHQPQGLWIMDIWVTAGELKFYRLFDTRCHVGTWFGEPKQVGSDSIVCVCLCVQCMRTRERHRGRQRTNSDPVMGSVGLLGEVKMPGERANDLIFSFLSFPQSHRLFSLTHKAWISGVDGHKIY